jgi:rhodanese-related sulfurtransferase
MTGARFITPAELETLMPLLESGERILLDIRTPAEFRSGHIRFSISIPLEELEKRSGELDKDKGLVIYCRTGKRCLRALPLLGQKGHDSVMVLEKGIEVWRGDLINE